MQHTKKYILKVTKKAKLFVWPYYKALGMRAQIICINLVNPGNTGRPYISIILLGLLRMLKDVGVMNRPPMTIATDGDA